MRVGLCTWGGTQRNVRPRCCAPSRSRRRPEVRAVTADIRCLSSHFQGAPHTGSVGCRRDARDPHGRAEPGPARRRRARRRTTARRRRGGFGEDRVLTHRIAHLIDEGVHPGRILAITFTNKAADEMRQRVGALVGPVVRSMWVSTFHSACVRILRANADRLGYPRSFSIYDQADAVRLTGYVIRDLALDAKRFPPRGVHGRHQPVEERARRSRCRRRPGREHLRPQAGRRVPRVPGAPAQGRGDGLRRPARQHSPLVPGSPRRARVVPPALRAHPRRRVPGHQPVAERDRPPARRRPPERHGRWRHRPIGVPVSGRGLPQHPAVRGRLPRGHHGGARPELPEHAEHPRRRQCGDRQQRHRASRRTCGPRPAVAT